jgi:hypothetical protein
VDDRWLKVGSSNLNPSSLGANYELDVLAEGKDLAVQGAAWFLRDLAAAVEIVLRERPVARRLPPVVAPRVPRRRAAVRSGRELSRRAVVTLRHVASGARRSILGAVVFSAVGAGALFLIVPQVMGYLVAVACFLLAVGAARHILARRRGE